MQTALPQFTGMDMVHFPEELQARLQASLERISLLIENPHPYSWDNLMQPIEDIEDALERFWSPIAHMHGVVNSPALRECYQACLPMLSAYEAAIGHNVNLYKAIKSINKAKLNPVQQKIIEDTLRDFELSGVALSAEEKKRFEAIQARLSELSNTFENNVLDAENAFELHITDESRLKGLPEHALHTAQSLAKEKNLEGWVLTLQYPCYIAVATFAEDRALREELYSAFVTRASDQGPTAGQFDNTEIINEILALRYEKAQLLGFENFAELSLATKMADTSDQVMGFLTDLSTRAHLQGEIEYKRLQNFANEYYQIETVQPWDIAYLSEKKKHKLWDFSLEELRPYFPQNKVMEGMFTVINKLYGMHFEEVMDFDKWHGDVKCFKVLDETNSVRGYIYMDLFSRASKRGGAWMDALQSRRKLIDGTIQLPIATLTCNFAQPHGNKPALLSHDEVLTLFHEFGHCLHHVLTKVDYLNASGIHGVEWDAVELPSQFFENWCWEQTSLTLLTAHVDSGEPLPTSLFNKLTASKNFQAAMYMLRQLEFAIFDFRIHREYKPGEANFVFKILEEVRQKTSVIPIVAFNRFPHSFSHVFAGGYAAGYYSYKWAKVLSSDAFSRFEEEGIFNQHTGRDFLHFILEVGGSVHAAEAYQGFRGRKASVDALLKHSGIK